MKPYCKINAYPEQVQHLNGNTELYWVAEAEGFDSLVATGNTCQEAITLLFSFLQDSIQYRQEHGWPVPEPYIHEVPDTTWERLVRQRKVAHHARQNTGARLLQPHRVQVSKAPEEPEFASPRLHRSVTGVTLTQKGAS